MILRTTTRVFKEESTPMSFPDYFSKHAELYEAFRPTYPDELFDYLAAISPSHEIAWDCATGNGQATVGLIPYFARIIATDASSQQIAEAKLHSKVSYIVATAEQTPLADSSVDLVTVSLAAHWFNHDRFHEEVRRVVKPGGIIACWTYDLQTVSPEVDAIVKRLYSETLGKFWAPQIRYIEDGYQSLPFPFEHVNSPSFDLKKTWDLPRLVAYMRTWSASQRYEKQSGRNLIDSVQDELVRAWGDPSLPREVCWELHMRVGRVN
jgi:ubiquinone/menaquinone biosynthesis C-methylase UbiE